VDVAPDIALNNKVNAFFKVEALDSSPAYARHQEKLLRDSGLIDESADTILEMRQAVVDYRAWEEKKSSKR
jgi:hypothetical protein